jgi:CRISPR-associated endonuclease/helicase Cas3
MTAHTAIDFDDAFAHLTGNPPFPWQQALYRRFIGVDPDGIPSTCCLPTGLGKTSVVGIWLLALAQTPEIIPRRLVYVVNRRTVVDQTTNEVEKYRLALAKTELNDVRKRLAALCAMPLKAEDGKTESPLALSTLRGQFADNREWSADPARPAVIVGTVDMIGSRLLFSGYGVGFNGKPLHAGFLGQDVLLVHDEAHLEAAFQELLTAIVKEQERCEEFRSFRVMELSATPRGQESFGLMKEDGENSEVKKRINAKKSIHLQRLGEEETLDDQIAQLALTPRFRDSRGAILVFLNRIDDVEKVVKKLGKEKQAVQQLTGTLRGLERDRMADPRKDTGCRIFARFLKQPDPYAPDSEKWKVTPKEGTVYLVCTSAGEVGVNISADHAVCDLATFDRMAQRFGRVNRFGDREDTEIHVVYRNEFTEGDDLDQRRARTLGLLGALQGNASPESLGKLDAADRFAAFAPAPGVLLASDILFDAWALTTIPGKALPGRPPVEPYLHGVDDNAVAETQFAWREEVGLVTGKVGADDIEELLDEAPLKPHELLRVTTFGKGRAYDQLQKVADRSPKLPVWVIEPDGSVVPHDAMAELVKKKGSDFAVPLAGRTVVLPPDAGGLTVNGTLDGGEAYSAGRVYDVAGLAAESPPWRFKVTVDAEGTSWLELVAPISGVPDEFPAMLTPGANRFKDLNAIFRRMQFAGVRPKFSLRLANSGDDEDETTTGIQEYLIVQAVRPKNQSEKTPAWPALSKHLAGVRGCALAICKALKLDEKLTLAIELAGAWHDLGKGRAVWQRGAGNGRQNTLVAKTIHGRAPENLNRYRHELGSLIDVCGAAELAKEFDDLTDDQRNIVLHLIAVHHGRGRPHFPEIEANDPESAAVIVESVANEVPTRFARLQRKYGRWGLAYLESILRAADILDSRQIEGTPLGEPVPGEWPKPLAKILRFPAKPSPTPSISINVDTANPGQFFACCGLLEIADRFWPGAKGWFEKRQFHMTCDGTLSMALDSLADCQITNTMTECEKARLKEISDWSGADRKKAPGVEAEYKALGKLVREAPIVLPNPIGLIIDWFTDDVAGGARFKTWAGQQSVLTIATSMNEALKDTAWRNAGCLSFSARRCGLPFNFDSDLGGQGGAIDTGFSFDPLAGNALTRIETTARPALELLAFIGLQRFRPREVNGQNRFVYSAWDRPLPIEVAMPAACGVLPTAGADRFEFRLLYRTKYLKSFLPAIPYTGGPDE